MAATVFKGFMCVAIAFVLVPLALSDAAHLQPSSGFVLKDARVLVRARLGSATYGLFVGDATSTARSSARPLVGIGAPGARSSTMRSERSIPRTRAVEPVSR